MVDIRNMNSSDNKIETIKEKFRKGVIEQYKRFIETGNDREFTNKQYEICGSGIGDSTPRWAILSKKNFFGLYAELKHETNESKEGLFLMANGGRFRIECCPFTFSREIDISDILEKSEDEQYSYITDFYNMNNRQLFEKYGVSLRMAEEKKFAAACLVLDSLLEGKYESIKDIFCHNHRGQSIEIELQDGTQIIARDNGEGITIKQGSREASVNFEGVYNKTDRKDRRHDNINNLEVENVVYTGNQELMLQLKQAMQEQFKSQQNINENRDENSFEQQVEEKIGAQKIIDFMKQNNLDSHDLSLALAMVLGKTTDRTTAEQQIISTVSKEKGENENNRSEQ